MLNVRFTFNFGHYVNSLKKFQQRFQNDAQNAVLSTSRQLLTTVIERTPNLLNHPRVPEQQIYERSGYMVMGWSSAANFLGLSTPALSARSGVPSHGAFRWIVSPDVIGFTAINDTQYAEHLEEIGPEIPTTRRVQGPYLMVAGAVAQHQNTLEKEVGAVLNSIPF